MSGQIDIGWAAPPALIEEVRNNRVRVIARLSDVEAFKNQTIRMNFAHINVITNKADQLKRFFAAYEETLNYMYSDPAALKIYADYAGITPDQAKFVRDTYFPKNNVLPRRISRPRSCHCRRGGHEIHPCPFDQRAGSGVLEVLFEIEHSSAAPKGWSCRNTRRALPIKGRVISQHAVSTRAFPEGWSRSRISRQHAHIDNDAFAGFQLLQRFLEHADDFARILHGAKANGALPARHCGEIEFGIIHALTNPLILDRTIAHARDAFLMQLIIVERLIIRHHNHDWDVVMHRRPDRRTTHHEIAVTKDSDGQTT
jgi:hypothetical protein